jgi:chitin synthase
MFLCVKHKNSGKLNSHMLFFEGFCKLFDPEFCILMDVGVKPMGNAIFQMYKHLELTPKCGGVCGYMSLKIENPSDDLGYRLDGYNEEDVDCLTRFINYLLSIQRAQQFEYHYAHMLDKPFESFFDYIHVLPGAFSGYRWKALKSVRYNDKEKLPNFDMDEQYT